MKCNYRHKAFLSVFIFIYAGFSAQEINWLKAFQGPGDEFINDIFIDKKGNVYVTGRFDGSTDLDPGPGTFTLSNSTDAVVAKLDASGNFQWAATFGAQATDSGEGIVVDDGGNIYVTGIFAYTVDFDPGPGVNNLTAKNSGFDVFLLKLNENGEFVWAKTIGGDNWDGADQVALDPDGNIYVLGRFHLDTVDVDPGSATYSLSFGYKEAAVIKFDPAGNFLSSFKPIMFGGKQFPEGKSDICIDSDGFLYTNNITGISKFNSAGNLIWSQAPGANAICADNEGNVYCAGNFNASTDFDPGPLTQTFTTNGGADSYVQKIDKNGVRLWLKNFGGTDGDWVYSMAVNNTGAIGIAGAFQETADFDPGPNTFSITSQGGVNAFFLELNSNGEFLNVRRIGGNNQDFATSVSFDPWGSIHIGGSFSSSATFGTGPLGTYSLTSMPQGYHDGFVLKLNSTVGLIKFEEVENFTFYPNPARDQIRIKGAELYDIRISDILGSIVTEIKNITGETTINLDNLPKGIYSVQALSTSQTRVCKLILE